MLKDDVGDAEVAFGILEVDRVDLVRHRRAANFAGNGALLEVADRDIAPDIAAEADEDRVEARQRMKIFGDVVVRLDLRGRRALRDAKCGDEKIGRASCRERVCQYV